MRESSRRENIILQLISVGVILNGLIIIAFTLVHQFAGRSEDHATDLLVSLPLVSGLTLVYLGSLLHRRKRVAWTIAVPLYGFILGVNVNQLTGIGGDHQLRLIIRNIILPLVMILALINYRKVFNVKSDIRNITYSLRITALILAITLVYGTMGYTLFDHRDFHVTITPVEAVHHTVDQFDFTTSGVLVPYTRRAHVFVDSLNIMTTAAIGYAIISLFQPLRFKFSSQNIARSRAATLLERYSRDSEDFFKLWPEDKLYYFDDLNDQHATLAYRVQNGVAVVVGDPIGNQHRYKRLVDSFCELCRTNDWTPTFAQVTDSYRGLYENNGMQLQKIGEEAVVDVEHFQTSVRCGKYFRQITNKFTKHGYTTEVLSPPHSVATLERLQQVSQQWLEQPGRQERTFMMGNYSTKYMEQCNVVVALDEAGVVQGFINQVPTFRGHEANYDLLRQSASALGNVNDYLLMAFIDHVQSQGFKAVNLGLSPLTGVGKDTEEKTIVDTALKFLYANGDRFYSFSGLHRFKAKYEPEWRSRYIAYKGGIRGLTRSFYALNKAMNRIKN